MCVLSFFIGPWVQNKVWIDQNSCDYHFAHNHAALLWSLTLIVSVPFYFSETQTLNLFWKQHNEQSTIYTYNSRLIIWRGVRDVVSVCVPVDQWYRSPSCSLVVTYQRCTGCEWLASPAQPLSSGQYHLITSHPSVIPGGQYHFNKSPVNWKRLKKKKEEEGNKKLSNFSNFCFCFYDILAWVISFVTMGLLAHIVFVRTHSGQSSTLHRDKNNKTVIGRSCSKKLGENRTWCDFNGFNYLVLLWSWLSWIKCCYMASNFYLFVIVISPLPARTHTHRYTHIQHTFSLMQTQVLRHTHTHNGSNTKSS